MTKAEYARHRGVTKPAVQKAVATGRIKLVDGQIDAGQADRDWDANTNAAQQRKPRVEGAAPKRGKESMSDAQTRKEIALANLRELEEGEKRKSLLVAEEYRDAVNGMVVFSRAKLLVIGDELADKLAATSDPVKCREMVDERIYQALSCLAEYPANAA